MNPLKRIATLSTAFLASNMARAAIAFLLSLVLGRALGAERFGRWVLCTTWAATLTALADLGLGVLLTRDGARTPRNLGPLLGGALTLRLTLLIPLGVLTFAVVTRLAVDRETIAGVRVGALLGVSGALYGCFASTFRSQPRWVATILGLETAWTAVHLLAASLIVWRGLGVVALITLATAVQLAQTVSALALWRFAFGDDQPIRVPSTSFARTMLGRALPFAASGIVANLQTRIGPLLLGSLSTEAELGFFAAASRFGALARMAPGAIFAGALPVLSNEYERSRGGANRVSRSLDGVTLTLSLAVALPCVFFAGRLLRIVYGPSFAKAAPALVWIAIGIIPGLMNASRRVFLWAAGSERSVVQWMAVGLGVQLLAAALLIRPLGSVGAAMSIVISDAAIWAPLRRLNPSSSDRRSGTVEQSVLPLQTMAGTTLS